MRWKSNLSSAPIRNNATKEGIPWSSHLWRLHAVAALQRVGTAGHAGNLAFQMFVPLIKVATRRAPEVDGSENRNREYCLRSENRRTCAQDVPILGVWQR